MGSHRSGVSATPRLTDWNDARLLVTAARTGSFAKAATALALTQPTVSRRIADLERRVGRTLFMRSPEGVIPTEVCRSLIGPAERMDAAASEFDQRLKGLDESMSGTVTVVAGEGAISYLLSANMNDLHEAFPQLGLKFRSDNNAFPHSVPDADIYVMPLAPDELLPWSGATLRTRRVARMAFVPFATSAYLDRHGHPRTCEDLRRHRLVNHIAYRHDGGLTAWNTMAAVASEQQEPIDVDTTTALVLAVRAGLGIGLLPNFAPKMEPSLVPVELDLPPMHIDLWLAGFEASLGAKRIRTVFDFLIQAFRRTPAWYAEAA